MHDENRWQEVPLSSNLRASPEASTSPLGIYKKAPRVSSTALRLSKPATSNQQSRTSLHQLLLQNFTPSAIPSRQAINMQFQLLLTILSLAISASAAPAPQPSSAPAPTCNNGQNVACCDSVEDGQGLGCVFSSSSANCYHSWDIKTNYLLQLSTFSAKVAQARSLWLAAVETRPVWSTSSAFPLALADKCRGHIFTLLRLSPWILCALLAKTLQLCIIINVIILQWLVCIWKNHINNLETRKK